jgi:biotin transporter BioY
MTTIQKIKLKLTELWSQFTEWLQLWPDSLGILACVLAFILTAPLFGWLADQFGDIESAILNNLLITVLEISYVNALVFLGILLNFRIIFDWYKKKHAIEKDWFTLTAWQRFIVFLVLYSSLFLSVVLLLSSLQ